MILINTVDSKNFTLDGVQFARIYQPLSQGSVAIGLYNIYDTRQQLQNSTDFDEFEIDGVTYATQEETIAALLDVIYSAVSDYDVEQLEQRVDNLEENQYSGVQVYSTYADLPATGTLLVSYKVSNDPDSSKNGYYHWDGAVYVKDASVVLNVFDENNTSDAFSGKAIDGQISERLLPVIDSPRLIADNAVLIAGQKVRTADGNLQVDAGWWYSDFIDVQLGTYELTAWVQTAYAVAAYDENENFIQGFPPPVTGNQTYQIVLSNPAIRKVRLSTNNAAYGSFSFNKTSEDISKTNLLEGLGLTEAFKKDEDSLADIELSTGENAEAEFLEVKEGLNDIAVAPYEFNLGTLISPGKITKSDGTLQTFDANWSATDFLPVVAGQLLLYTGWSDASYGVALYDESQVYVGTVDPDPGEFPSDTTSSYHFYIPANAAFVRISSNSVGYPTFALKKIGYSQDLTYSTAVTKNEIVKDKKLSTLFVAKTGNDANSGVFETPLLTINKAIELLPYGGTVVVRAGDYYETLDVTKLLSGKLKIQTQDFDKVRIMGSDEITGFTKTAGRNLIYEASFSGTIELTGDVSAYGYRIFEDGVESLLISDSERNALQRGQSYRLPYSEIKQITDQGSLSLNLDFLDALGVGESGYWYDQTGNKIYVVNAAQGNVSSSSIHYAARQHTTVSSGVTTGYQTMCDIELRDLQFFYSNDIGLKLFQFNKVTLWNIGLFAARQTGIDEQGSHSYMEMVEAANCGRDGIASALYFDPPNGTREKARWNNYRNIWCHDNYDDGFSVHQNGACSIDKFLFEYNPDTGLQNIGASYTVLQNGVTRKNGKGVVINGAAPSTHTRWGTSLEGRNIISEENNINYDVEANLTDTPAILNLYDCVSRNATNYGYDADQDNSVINAHNCKSTGDNVSKRGNVNVTNDSDLL